MAALAQIVESLIAVRLPRRLGEEEAARLIGTSRRTLVRRLAESDLAYRSLLDGVLRERARAMLSVAALSRDEMAARARLLRCHQFQPRLPALVRQRIRRPRRLAHRFGATRANIAPCGSRPCTIHCPPGTSCGPLMIWPPLALISSAAASTASTLK